MIIIVLIPLLLGLTWFVNENENVLSCSGAGKVGSFTFHDTDSLGKRWKTYVTL